MIRRATFNDIPAMLELGRRAHGGSRYAHLAIDESQAKLNVASMMNNKAQCVFVAEEGGRLVGILLGITVPWFFSRAAYATDVFTFAEKPGVGVRLVKRFIRWAFDERRVGEIETCVSFGGDSQRTERMYQRLGFERVGGYFSMKRPQQAMAVKEAA